MVAEPRDAGVAADPYATMGLDPTASADDVRRAYRRLARVLHPDASPHDADAAERFRQVTVAYEVLRDPIRRTALDRQRRGVAGPRPARIAPGPSGNTAVRGPAARPSHRPQDGRSELVRRETDEWALLGRFLRWGLATAVLAIVVMVTVTFMSVTGVTDGPDSPVLPTGGVPGGGGFCETPDGWVSCRNVQFREP